MSANGDANKDDRAPSVTTTNNNTTSANSSSNSSTNNNPKDDVLLTNGGGDAASPTSNKKPPVALCASCDRCRARKTKCDGKRPCGNCATRYMKKHKLSRYVALQYGTLQCIGSHRSSMHAAN